MNTKSNSSSLSSLDSKLTRSKNRQDRALVMTKPLDRLESPTLEQKKSIALIYVEQAGVYCQEHNWHKAILACKNALEIAPDLAEAYRILGNILYRQGKQAQALGIYAKALTIDPNLSTVYANVAALYADRKDWKKALDYYQQAVILDPNLAETYRGLARAWEELGEEEKALECFCRAIDLDPQILDIEDYFDFGRELYRQGKAKEASILFIQGIELNPFAQTELTQLIQMLEELEEWQQAVVYYHQLMALPNVIGSSLEDTAPKTETETESSQHKPIKKLLSSSKAAVKMSAKNTQNNIPQLPEDTTQKLLPKAARSSSQSFDSVDVSQIALQQPNSALSWNNLGSIYAQQKQWQKAISCYQEALQLDPNFAKSYRNLARVYSNIGEPLKSALYWHEAFIIEPEIVKPEEYFGLAKKLLQYQQPEKAIALLQRAIELKPNYKEAQLTLDRLTSI